MFKIELTQRELVNVLAALRTAQEDYPVFQQMPHFVESGDDQDVALSLEQLDELCEKINCS